MQIWLHLWHVPPKKYRQKWLLRQIKFNEYYPAAQRFPLKTVISQIAD